MAKDTVKKKASAAARDRTAPTHGRKPKVITDGDGGNAVANVAPKATRLVVNWDNARTTRLLDWLDQNPDDRHKLFSDSHAYAKAEGRRKVKAKGSKGIYHERIAKSVFDSPEETPATRQRYAKEPEKFASSVSNYIGRLRTGYRSFNDALGKTGAGLDYSEVTPGSDLHNLIDKLKVDFPHWERLHGYWRSLPNFNPHVVNSEPDQNLELEARALLIGDSDDEPDDDNNNNQDLNAEELQEVEDDPDADADGEEEEVDMPDKPSPTSATKGPDSQPIIPATSFGSSRYGITATSLPVTVSRKPMARSGGHTPRSSLGKRDALTAFGIDHENDSAIAASLRSKKLDRELASLAVQKAKLELLAQREANKLRMMELQLQMQRQRAELPVPQVDHAPSAGPSVRLAATDYNMDPPDMFNGMAGGSMQALLHGDLDFNFTFGSQS